jgi:hypothetical protein
MHAHEKFENEHFFVQEEIKTEKIGMLMGQVHCAHYHTYSYADLSFLFLFTLYNLF